MGITRFLRAVFFTGIAVSLICGCSKGNAPTLPPIDLESTRATTQDEFDYGGDATSMLPPLAWEFTEPADLLDPGWGRFPATASTSLYIAANLIGY